MKVPVVKLKTLRLMQWSSTGWGQNMLYLGDQLARDPELFPYGKIILSYPFKKGRRKLIKGYITANPHSSPSFGLIWEYFFVPSSVVQLQKVQELNQRMEKRMGLA